MELFHDPRLLKEGEQPRYQWYWAGNPEETEILTPDLKYTVKRHVVVKRIITVEGLLINAEAAQLSKSLEADGMLGKRRERAQEKEQKWKSPEQEWLEYLLDFSFCVRVRQDFLLYRPHCGLAHP